jgi:hypothetical protein
MQGVRGAADQFLVHKSIRIMTDYGTLSVAEFARKLGVDDLSLVFELLVPAIGNFPQIFCTAALPVLSIMSAAACKAAISTARVKGV